MEEYKVATADISGVFLRTEIDEDLIVVFEGQTIDMLHITDPSYEEFVLSNSFDKKIVYVKIRKFMYGSNRVARL